MLLCLFRIWESMASLPDRWLLHRTSPLRQCLVNENASWWVPRRGCLEETRRWPTLWYPIGGLTHWPHQCSKYLSDPRPKDDNKWPGLITFPAFVTYFNYWADKSFHWVDDFSRLISNKQKNIPWKLESRPPIPFLLMAWLLVLLVHQQPWHWPYNVGCSLSLKARKRICFQCTVSVSRNFITCKYILMFLKKIFQHGKGWYVFNIFLFKWVRHCLEWSFRWLNAKET